MPLYFYCYPEHLDQAEYIFEQTKEIIALYSRLFGEYPFIDSTFTERLITILTPQGITQDI